MRRALPTIVLAGVVAGVLDILDPLLIAWWSGGSPVRVLQVIASGVIGPDAYQRGAASATLGLALHFFISTTVAAVYVIASRALPVLVRRPIACGVIFGLGVWAVMYLLVLPITFGRPYRMPGWPQLLNQLGIHTLGVGLPIALIASRAARRRRVGGGHL